ncbi:bem46 protein, variant, partial [Basidiobolus ranarum]
MAYLTRMPRVLRLPTSLKYLLAFTGVATLSGLTLVYLLQCKLIYPAYFPSGSRKKVDFPSLYDMDDYEDVTLTTSDGEELKAYLITRETEEITRKAPTLLYLHANAGNMGHRLPIAKRFHQRFRCNILMLSYRGYGFSTGSPSESGLRIDAQTALNFILGHPLLKNTKIVVYGQSIGGAVAGVLVARNEDK